MRFAIVTIEGSTFSWWRRLHDEGHEVLVYFWPKDGKPAAQRNIGKGLIKTTASREEFVKWGSADPNTIWFFDCTDAGDFAELLRTGGKLVVGGGKLMDRLEKDRAFGTKFAEQCGMLMPPTKEFPSISAAKAFLESKPKQEFGDGGWAWKSDKCLEASATFVGDHDAVIDYLGYAQRRWGDKIACILQERIKGVALSTAQWWNGRTWAGPVEGTLEEKKLLNGDKGPATGCALNLVWFYRDYPNVAHTLQWDNLGTHLRSCNAPPGLYDVNAIVNKRGAWFLEWTPRLGIDSELTSQRGITDLGELLQGLALGRSVDHLFDTDQVYVGVRISVPPYPVEAKGIEDLKIISGLPIHGADGLWQDMFVGIEVQRGPDGLEVAGPYGLVGCIVNSGTSLKTAFDEVYEYLDNKLEIANLQYRTDACAIICKDIEDMLADGDWETTSVMEIE